MSNFITQESIDEVSNKSDIVSIINEYVPLTQKGADFWGHCPFHQDKTPSFSVSPSKKFYYCFSCHAKGTLFNFIMEMDKVSYPAAIEILAKKAGVQLRYSENSSGNVKKDESYQLKNEMINLYNRVATAFHYMLMETKAGKFALDYITQRGLAPETLEKFKLGYSPRDMKWLHKFLLQKNYSAEFLSKSGLFSQKEMYSDIAFFSDRLMFPIFDDQGQVVAMGGRFLRGNPDKSPKYLNSRDLIQYKKGQTLYAFNFAKASIRERHEVIFCEGYMDVIAYHQCGITWAVAPLGTALTEDQVRKVKAYDVTVYLSFDSDGAGQKATRAAIFMCRKMGLPVKVIRLHGGKDPAEIMNTFGPEYLTNEIKGAIFDDDFLISKLLELYPKDTPEGKAKASLDFFEYVDSLQSDVQKDACLEKLCQTYGINKESCRKDFLNREQLSKRYRNTSGQEKVPQVQEQIKLSAELRAVLTAVTDDVNIFKKMRNEISPENLQDLNARKLFIIMGECQDSNCFSVSSILNRVDSDAFRGLIIQYSQENDDNVQRLADESSLYLRLKELKQKNEALQQKIAELSSSSLPEDKSLLQKLLVQKMDITQEIARIKDR